MVEEEILVLVDTITTGAKELRSHFERLQDRISRLTSENGELLEENCKYMALADELEGTMRKIAERAMNGTPYHNAQEMCAAAEAACEAYRYACLSPELRAAEDRAREMSL